MTIWFTGDTHFGHTNIIKYCNRPFTCVEDMDETLIQNWNANVAKGDTVYHLGDFAFHKTAEGIEELANRLNGQIHLILGNHDWEPTKRAENSFVWRGEKKRIKIDRVKITLDHYAGRVWWCSHHGAWMLCGHSHGTLRVRFGKLMDVGVDPNGYRPVSFDEVRQYMDTRKVGTWDHHVENEGEECNQLTSAD